MESESNKTTLAITIIAVIAIIGGIIWVLGMDSETDTQDQADTTQQETQQETEQATGDIVTLASETESLSTLVTAVQAAELVETLQGDGPFTVFAPTNDAFAALPDGTLESLLEPENQDQLASILTYHVVAGAVFSDDLSDGQVVETVQGETLTVNINNGVVTLTDATGGEAAVQTADVEATNGVVHVIDTVLLFE